MGRDTGDTELAEGSGLDDTLAISPRETIRPESRALIRETSSSDWHALPRIVVGETLPGTAHEELPDIFLGAPLGRGGMGEVRSGKQRSLEREVAVKSLAAGADATLAKYLVSEALLAGSLAHPGIIPVHSLGLNQHEQPVLVMKKITGTAWSQLVHDDEHPEWTNWQGSTDHLLVHLEILSRVCDALHFAHVRGVVHRDIKPDNVMLGQFGEVYLVDWGLAVRYAEHEPGQLGGTLGYLAPEMASGDPVDPRTDVYLLGATLHELLTKSSRHDGNALSEILEAARESAPAEYPKSVPPSLAQLANAATARSPEDRPQSALEFRQRLDEFFQHRSSIALSDAALGRLFKLEELLEQGEPQDPGHFEVTANRLVTEARFGFDQALELWPQNEVAESGSLRCREARVEIALLRHNAATARAALEELKSASPELTQRVEKLEAEVAAQRKKQLELEDLEYSLDSRVGSGSRRIAYVAVAFLAIAISAVSVLKPAGLRGFTHPQSTGFAFIVFCLSGVLILAFRKPLLKNAFNSKVVALYMLTVGFMTVHRAIAWKVGIPLHQVFLVDLLLFALGTSAAGVLLMRWLLILTAWFLASAVLVVFRPVDAALFFVIATVGGALGAVALWRR